VEPTIKIIEGLLPIVVVLVFVWFILWLIDRF